MLIYLVDKTRPVENKHRFFPEKIKLKADVSVTGKKQSGSSKQHQMDVRLNCDLGPAGKVVVGFVLSKNDLQGGHSANEDSVTVRH